jgi:hypothetical protein
VAGTPGRSCDGTRRYGTSARVLAVSEGCFGWALPCSEREDCILSLRAVFLSLGLAAVGCSPVPDLVFAEAGAGVDAGVLNDSEVARPEPSPLDAAPDVLICNLVQPGDHCCGLVVCRGSCTVQDCTTCQSKCSSAEVCCVHKDITCKSNSKGC